MIKVFQINKIIPKTEVKPIIAKFQLTLDNFNFSFKKIQHLLILCFKCFPKTFLGKKHKNQAPVYVY